MEAVRTIQCPECGTAIPYDEGASVVCSGSGSRDCGAQVSATGELIEEHPGRIAD